VADPKERSERKSEASAPKGRSTAIEAEAVNEPSKAQGGAEQIRDRNKRIREEAAAKRRGKREAEARRVAPARNLDTSEIVDDALARTTHAASNWLKKHFNTVQWLVLALVVGGIGYQIYSYRRGVEAARSMDELHRAMKDEHARVGTDGDTSPDKYSGLEDTRASFPDDTARLKAAAESYRKVESSGSSTTSALASLGLAGVLFDQGKFAEAKAEYEKVKTSSLAAKDADVRGRAIEGSGLSSEGAGNDEAALASFRELANSDKPVFAALGEYHQSRLLFKADKRAEAKALLVKALGRLTDHGDKEKKTPAPGGAFLEREARELLRSIDPSAVPKESAESEQLANLKKQFKIGTANGKIDQKQIDEILKQLAKQQPKAPGSSAPAEAPAPAGSAP
jgi:tetratricopeptide (TPR) repeat protein